MDVIQVCSCSNTKRRETWRLPEGAFVCQHSCSLRTSLITVEVCTVPVLSMWAHTRILLIHTHRTFITLIHPCRPWIKSFQLSFTHSNFHFRSIRVIRSFPHSNFHFRSIRFIRSFTISFTHYFDQLDSFGHPQFRPTWFSQSFIQSIRFFVGISPTEFATGGSQVRLIDDSFDSSRKVLRNSEFRLMLLVIGDRSRCGRRVEMLPFIQAWPLLRHGQPWKFNGR